MIKLQGRGRHKLLRADLYLGAVCVSCAVAAAQSKLPRRCSSAEFESVIVRHEADAEISWQTPPGLTVAKQTKGRTIVIATGPILGTMDALDISYSTSCSHGAVHLDALIVRSADYKGGTLKYASWRPDLKVLLTHTRPGSSIQVTWHMQTSAGVVVHRADFPDHPAQVFPIVLTADLR